MDKSDKNNVSQESIIKALNNIFTAFIIFRMSDLVIEFFQVPAYVSIEIKDLTADAVGHFFLKNSIDESELEKAQSIFDFNTLQKRLDDAGGTITSTFLKSIHGWLETKLISLDTDSEGKTERVLFCAREINKEARVEENFNEIHKLINSGMWRINFDENNKVHEVEFSDEFRNMLGYESVDEFPNSLETWFLHLHPEDKAAALGSAQSIIQGKTDTSAYDVEYRVRTKSSGYRWFHMNGTVARRADGSAKCFFGVFIDITEKKEKEELLATRDQALDDANKALETINALHESLDSASWSIIFNEKKEIREVRWSRKFKDMLGFKPVDFPNTWDSWFSKVHPWDKNGVLSEFKRTIGDSSLKYTFNFEYRILTGSNGYKWFRSAGKVVRSEEDGLYTLHGILLDIDEQKKNKEQLQAALEAAENANKAKSAFLFNMSHDIRTPMNAIMGYTELMDWHTGDRDKLEEYVAKMKKANLFMLSILNNVLEMSRIESGKMTVELEVSNFKQLNDSIISVFENDIKQKNITFTQNFHNIVNNRVLYDSTKIRQIFLNLLNNAVKYTPNGGKITMEFYEHPCEKPGFASFQIDVIDTGIGMSKEFLPHVFEEFSREKNSTDSGIIGTGLGMPIVKKLVDLMGGKITVESELNVGTTFSVFLSFKIAEEQKEEEPLALEDNVLEFTIPGEKRILLVEDNDLNAEIAQAVLEAEGFEVEYAKNGFECIDMFTSNPPDHYRMILMDIQMPGMDGYETTKKIREMAGTYANIPIIAMTANAFDSDKEDAMNAGMNAHISKPINVEKLISVMGKFM